jgi:hypothetical protein
VDAERFDDVTRLLATTAPRRVALAALAGTSLTVLVYAVGWEAADAKRRKRKGKRKNIKRNAFGCVDVGKACRGKDANCCSGTCQGKKPKRGKRDKSRCVAHNTGGCQPEDDNCAGLLMGCGEFRSGICYRTTGKGSFCARAAFCGECAKDVDCIAITGPGSACGFCPGGGCAPGSDTICLPPYS